MKLSIYWMGIEGIRGNLKMQAKFKRGQKVRILIAPDLEYIEYHTENTEHEQVPIKKGMSGKVNVILPNGQYHVEIFDEDGKELAYAMLDEEALESAD